MTRAVLTAFLLFLSLTLFAETTRAVVRAHAKDAKFIGTGIGGAYVVIRNDLTGEILAKGLTTGASGNTELIMNTAIKRNDRLTDDQTAKFIGIVDIDEPVFVTIEVTAPVNRKNAAIKVSTQVWLIPGKHIEGDGIVLEVPGFILDVLAPQTHQVIPSASLKDNKVLIKANLVMMCGCAISKGGTWNSEDIEVKAIVKLEGKKLAEVPLHITDQTNVFEGTLDASAKGNYELQLYAYDRKTGNTGVDKVNFVIQ
ncbi:hypothetical protein C3K47_00280 [Solitalea longa]|uniref:DUF4625 domain-containing protein n=2 Tax=Solitalea longa TaxID=2079460 RepID=A0A2S5A9W7_9SPHI|nr:hypothetical protein C3K47_00280 [Solitalea longa]